MKSTIGFCILVLLTSGIIIEPAFGLEWFMNPKINENAGYYPDSYHNLSLNINTGNSTLKIVGVKLDVYLDSNIEYDIGKSIVIIKGFHSQQPIYFSELFNIEDYAYPSYQRDTYFLSLVNNQQNGVDLITDQMGNDQHWIDSVIATNFEYPSDSIKVKTTVYYIENGNEKIHSLSGMGIICAEKCYHEKPSVGDVS